MKSPHPYKIFVVYIQASPKADWSMLYAYNSYKVALNFVYMQRSVAKSLNPGRYIPKWRIVTYVDKNATPSV